MAKYKKCINHLFRPKIKIPSWARDPRMGDCTTCKPCKKNKDCIGYYPAPGLLVVDSEKEKT
jgi:hypothetical protein